MITIDELKVQLDNKSRLLGVDMGSKRIGISICDENRKIATPLETIEFMPLASADPFGGIIITDWYSGPANPGERCKLNIFIKGVEMKTNNLKVSSFCQKLSTEGIWMDQPINESTNADLENAILNKAKKIRLAQS